MNCRLKVCHDLIDQVLAKTPFLISIWSYFFLMKPGKWLPGVSSGRAFFISKKSFCTNNWLPICYALRAEFSLWSTDSGMPIAFSYCAIGHIDGIRSLEIYEQFTNICIDPWFRLQLFKYRNFLSLEERKKLYNVLRKVNCGDQHLFLHLNLVIGFVNCKSHLLSRLYHYLVNSWFLFIVRPDLVSTSWELHCFIYDYEQFYGDIVKQMALKHLVAGSPLQTLCLLIGGNSGDKFSNVAAGSNVPGLNAYGQVIVTNLVTFFG